MKKWWEEKKSYTQQSPRVFAKSPTNTQGLHTVLETGGWINGDKSMKWGNHVNFVDVGHISFLKFFLSLYQHALRGAGNPSWKEIALIQRESDTKLRHSHKHVSLGIVFSVLDV